MEGLSLSLPTTKNVGNFGVSRDLQEIVPVATEGFIHEQVLSRNLISQIPSAP